MQNGETAFRLQATFLPWKTASKVLRLTRNPQENCAQSASDMEPSGG
jgi:hypothetical protein